MRTLFPSEPEDRQCRAARRRPFALQDLLARAQDLIAAARPPRIGRRADRIRLCIRDVSDEDRNAHSQYVTRRDGTQRWTRTSDARALQTFTTGDLFEKHTNQIVALWNDSHSSRLTILESDGRERSSFEIAGPLLHVAIGRPTNMHASRIVAATANALLLFHPRKLQRGIPIWRQLLRASTTGAISDIRIVDASSGGHRNIAVVTTRGTTAFTFEGKIAGPSRKGSWEEGARRKKRRTPQIRGRFQVAPPHELHEGESLRIQTLPTI